MRERLQQKWDQLSPGAKRAAMVAVLGGSGAAIIAVIVLMSGDPPPRPSRRDQDIKSVLTARDPRELTIEDMSARMKALTEQNEKLAAAVEGFRSDANRKAAVISPDAVDRRFKEVHDRNRVLEEKLEQLQAAFDSQVKAAASAPAVIPEPGGRQSWSAGATGSPTATASTAPEIDANLFARGPVPAAGTNRPPAPGTSREALTSGSVRLIRPEPLPVAEAPDAPDVIIPVGSIFSAVLLSGLDAPTGEGARQNPHPVVARVKDLSILPNRFRADFRECFVILSGYGDLSTERAYLRADKISCIATDETVMEASIQAVATGKDGKHGVSGRLVTKQGQLIAKALMAGFADGVAKAFTRVPVPSLSVSDRDTVAYQRVLSADSVTSATMTGTGEALERIADYYMTMAEGMYPVIEVNAGQLIDFILVSGWNVSRSGKTQSATLQPTAASAAASAESIVRGVVPRGDGSRN
ncbi:MAG: hypothetical protein CMO30_15225 [Tistrella sp.]|uniref:TrbI/VirB10 family protein n=1 Tax=Tistrella sp. TaxID=2024861 RepID=UPI000C6ABB72|nr:TrbI/VirB10 family protein [Tistrella sp.]MAD35813.1 hypothetical protein [Tistrella sp.]MBA76620.1 hypothetical protein [Tistrella sp.]